MTASPFDTDTITAPDMIVGINRNGGYVSGWKMKQPGTATYVDILYQGKTQKRTGIPVLFPQFSEAPGLPKHGFGRDIPWTVTDQNTHSITMQITDADVPAAFREAYPYPFRAEITVTAAAAALRYSLHVTNTGSTPLPLAPGLHPYWAVPHEQKRAVRLSGIPFDAAAIDWEANPPDSGYPYTGKTLVQCPAWTVSIEDVTPEGPVITHIVVWSQTPQQDDFRYICVEPVTRYQQGLTHDPILVMPGERWLMEIVFSVNFA